MSGCGTNRTSQVGLTLSVDWSRPEVAGKGVKTALLTHCGHRRFPENETQNLNFEVFPTLDVR